MSRDSTVEWLVAGERHSALPPSIDSQPFRTMGVTGRSNRRGETSRVLYETMARTELRPGVLGARRYPAVGVVIRSIRTVGAALVPSPGEVEQPGGLHCCAMFASPCRHSRSDRPVVRVPLGRPHSCSNRRSSRPFVGSALKVERSEKRVDEMNSLYSPEVGRCNHR